MPTNPFEPPKEVAERDGFPLPRRGTMHESIPIGHQSAPMRTLIAFLLLALASYGACADEPAVTLKALQGTWKCIWFEYQGVKMDKLDAGGRLVIKDNEWTWAKAAKAKITLDSTTSPTVIDLAFDDGVSEGICRLNGDKFTVCLVVDPRDKIKRRPMKFETEGGDGFEVIYFEREAEK